MRITKKAYGKINLTLEVESRRDDGYHELNTVMQTVSLYDVLSVSNECEEGIHISCNMSFVPTDDRNIVYKTIEKFYSYLGKKSYSVAVDIQKNIPVGGGMAGGSTDCGAVLMSLNDIEKKPFSFNELLNIGGKLGADVPFTMVGGAALATGIGDVLKPVKPLPNCHIVLCKPKFSISTKSAFSALSEEDFSKDNKSLLMEKLLEEGNVEKISKALYNSFENPLGKSKQEIFKIKNKLLECGALGAIMTGSGSTVYGIFNSIRKAECAKKTILKSLSDVFIVKPIGK